MVIKINNNQQQNINMSLEKKELVGNRKEFRIEINKIHLRIIGNSNKIILKSNYGILDIIGNFTRVKVLNNCGKINYIGNSGKVYIGKESIVTSINHTGNDLKFRILPIEQLKTNNNNKKQQNDQQTTDEEKINENTNKNKITIGTTTKLNMTSDILNDEHVNCSRVNREEDNNNNNNNNNNKNHNYKSNDKCGNEPQQQNNNHHQHHHHYHHHHHCNGVKNIEIRNHISLPNLDLLENIIFTNTIIIKSNSTGKCNL